MAGVPWLSQQAFSSKAPGALLRHMMCHRGELPCIPTAAVPLYQIKFRPERLDTWCIT